MDNYMNEITKLMNNSNIKNMMNQFTQNVDMNTISTAVNKANKLFETKMNTGDNSFTGQDLDEISKIMQDTVGLEKTKELSDSIMKSVNKDFINNMPAEDYNSVNNMMNNPNIAINPQSFDLSNLVRIVNKVFAPNDLRYEYFVFDGSLSYDLDKNTNPTCFICHDEFIKKEQCVKCDNNHVFHRECYFEYLEMSGKKDNFDCMYCKTNMTKNIFEY